MPCTGQPQAAAVEIGKLGRRHEVVDLPHHGVVALLILVVEALHPRDPREDARARHDELSDQVEQPVEPVRRDADKPPARAGTLAGRGFERGVGRRLARRARDVRGV